MHDLGLYCFSCSIWLLWLHTTLLEWQEIYKLLSLNFCLFFPSKPLCCVRWHSAGGNVSWNTKQAKNTCNFKPCKQDGWMHRTHPESVTLMGLWRIFWCWRIISSQHTCGRFRFLPRPGLQTTWKPELLLVPLGQRLLITRGVRSPKSPTVYCN